VSRRIDLDHTIRYLSPDSGGPPGQTSIGNLGPFTRRHHLLKTHAGWQVRQPEPGTCLWRSPHHRIYLVNASGTHPLGDTDFAQTTWRAAASLPQGLVLTRIDPGVARVRSVPAGRGTGPQQEATLQPSGVRRVSTDGSRPPGQFPGARA